MTLTKIAKTIGLGAAVLAMTAGAAFAATATSSVNVRTGRALSSGLSIRCALASASRSLIATAAGVPSTPVVETAGFPAAI